MHDCKNCGGCDRSLTLTPGELEILDTLAQIPFLPIARTAADPAPVYLESDAHTPEEYALILQCLEKKGLIDLDYRVLLTGFDYRAYSAYPVHGSMALTARGLQVLELLDFQGATEE